MESKKCSIFICRHGERLDYKFKERGENWQAQALRPWDTPLTEGGLQQAAACGRAILKHCERFGLAPVQQILASPFLRCAQTAAAAAIPLTIASVGICPNLAENMSEDWYVGFSLGADWETRSMATNEPSHCPMLQVSLMVHSWSRFNVGWPRYLLWAEHRARRTAA